MGLMMARRRVSDATERQKVKEAAAKAEPQAPAKTELKSKAAQHGIKHHGAK